MTTIPTKLLPCPFCGSTELRINHSDIEGWIAHVECTDCDDMLGPMSKFKYDSKDEASTDAAEVWNRRAALPHLSKTVDAEGQKPNMLELAVAAVLEADKEFRSNLSPEWEGDPLSDELDGLRRIFEARHASPQPAGTVAQEPVGAFAEKLIQLAENVGFLSVEDIRATLAPPPAVAQEPYGHWVKHRLTDGVFFPKNCYVPTGPDYTVIPLFKAAPAQEPVAVKVYADAFAASIVTAACELDGPADPEADDTISIKAQDLEAVAHRHITVAFERALLASPLPAVAEDDWFSKVANFFVQNGMLDERDEYDLDDVMSALRDNYEPKPPAVAEEVGVKALDADDVINQLAAMPCETAGPEDLETGCCRTCRARAIRSALFSPPSEPAPQVVAMEGLQTAFRDAFMTCVAGDGKPYIKLQFSTLDQAHFAHDMLLAALASQEGK